ncbi:MAG: hypothetical protein KY476_07140 [Planctomycetes bacterium]|nr:hypothetical protein [Planctomycetota bacterium]
MPIKFRCNHCRQFLGISRSRAGAVVDCPTCGRTLRVPNLDGTLDPLPEPGMDLGDSGLSQALDELARIGHGTGDGGDDLAADAGDDSEEITRKEPPRAIELPPAPEPIPIDPPPPADPLTSKTPVPPPPTAHGRSGRPREGNGNKGSWPEDDALDTASPSQIARLRDLREDDEELRALLDKLGIGLGDNAAPVPRDRFTPSPRRAVAVLAIAAVAAMGVGFLLGRWTAPDASSGPHGNSQRKASGPSTAPGAAAPDSASKSLVKDVAVHGRITYRTPDGMTKPDQDARVLALPKERRGSAPLPAAAFRATDADSPDFRLASASLMALGGDLALAGADGQYALQLPDAGSYTIVVLSNHLEQDELAASDGRLEAVLSAWFDQPARLLGTRRRHADTVQFDGTQPVPFDHSFR